MKDIKDGTFIKMNSMLKMLLIAALVWGLAVFSVPSNATAAGSVSSVKLINSKQAIERAKQLHLLPGEEVIITTTKLTETEESWKISYTTTELDALREPKLRGEIVLSVATGELLHLSKQVKLSSGVCEYPCDSWPSVEEAREIASDFVNNLDLNLDAEWKLDDSPALDVYRDRFGSLIRHISFDRIHEGIRFPNNQIIISINEGSREVYKYSVTWDKVKFVWPQNLISYSEAGRIFFDTIEPALLLADDLQHSNHPEQPENPRLVYSTSDDYMLDPKGKVIAGYSSRMFATPETAKTKYPVPYAKHRLLSLYELELYYMDLIAGQAEPNYRLRLKPGVPVSYTEPLPYIDAENGEWINFLFDPLPDSLPPASDWLINHIAPAGKVNYKAAVVWNNELVKLENEPIINNGFTLVPFRELLEKLNANISWDPVKRKVTASKNGTTIELTIDSDTAYINGKPQSLGTPARISKGRTYIPARIVLETFGTKVGWNAASRLVLVQTDTSLPKLTSLQIDQLRLHAQLNWEENDWKP